MSDLMSAADGNIFPLYLPLPDHTGETGRFRMEESACRSTNDYQIALSFLANWKDSPHTFMNYRKEINRYLGWLCRRKMALSDACFEDIVMFDAYLAEPPASDIGEKRLSIAHRDYKPFMGPLSPASRRQAIIILSSFYEFMIQQRYTEYNPFGALRTHKPRGKKRESSDDMPSRSAPQDRCIELPILQRLTDSLKAAIELSGGDRIKERQLWLFTLLYSTGARLEEIAHGFMGDFMVSGLGTENPIWHLRVLGKGQKVRNIPASSELMLALARYRQVYGLHPLPVSEEDKTRALVMSTSGKLPVGRRMIYNIVKDTFEWFSSQLDPSDTEDSVIDEKIKAYSTHWFRHTFATQLMNNGTPIDKGAQIMGHANPATTSLYVKENDRLNWMEVETRLPRLNGSDAAPSKEELPQ